MNIIIFDTETISVDKPFCYNIGYTVVEVETRTYLAHRDFVVEQIWHNIPLFNTAYYADKRPLYVSAMRGKRATLDKWGYIMRIMRNDIKAYNVEGVYAYNSLFDDRVMEYNNDWYKTINPIETIPIYDIRGYAIEYLVDEKYKAFCDKYGFYTESGNYSTTAETMYRYLMNDPTFEEAHTALADAEIETEILFACLNAGATIGTVYKVPRSIEKEYNRHLVVKENGKVLFETDCKKITVSKDKQTITLK